MKIALKILLIVGILSYIVFAVVQFAQRPEEGFCVAVDVEVTDEEMQAIITPQYIYSILSKHHFSPEGQQLKEIDLQGMEDALMNDPYICQAQCFYRANNHLCVRVTPLRPILHVLSHDGGNYYVDTTGVCMPFHGFNMDLCVATGYINPHTIKQQLIPLAWYIHENEYWNHQTEQIHVDASGTIYLSPRVGTHRILLGSADDYEEKLDKMRIFNEEGFPRVGWNKYRTIDLRFKGQVVGIK